MFLIPVESDLEFSNIVSVLKLVEATTQRTVMAKALSSLLKKTPPQVIDKVIYFLLGSLRPDWEGVELGLAERLTLRAISMATGLPIKQVEDLYKRLGDAGEVARRAVEVRRSKGTGGSIFDFIGSQAKRSLTISKVYDSLMAIAKASGEGAQDTKIKILSSLLTDAEPDEAKYITRFVIGRLRLGVADMTILDALSDAFDVNKDLLEKAYHVYPDLGRIAKALAEGGEEAVKAIKVTPGVPIQPMLAERLSSPKEILNKLGGVAICEFKYDGERMQIHKLKDGTVKIFSRRMEDITNQYPDVAEYVREAVDAEEFIVEGEGIAIDPDTGEFRPFQELMHRKRKHNIKEAIEEYPINLYLFDVMYVNGQDLTDLPLPDRKKILFSIIKPHEHVHHADWIITDDADTLEKFFLDAISSGCEGVMCKSVKIGSIYEMGARGWLWIKYKRDYKSELSDTMDLVVVGAFWGRGKRAGTYGALLLAAYDPDSDQFYTVCKVGSGFTDEDLKKLPQMLEPYKIPHRHPRVVSKMEPDVWFTPGMVLEITGAEITMSPLHTCCSTMLKGDVGLAIRFPRFTGRYRTDKKPEDATTVKEIFEMYNSQKKVKLTDQAP